MQRSAGEVRISDWSSDVCSSDLDDARVDERARRDLGPARAAASEGRVKQAAGFDEVVVARRSIRGFLDKPVPRALIAEILEVAMRAPSSFNKQCWNFSEIGRAHV